MNRTIKDADLNDYLYFAEAVAHGGFAAASRVLNLPKSKLSRRIARLEARLGLSLIERSTRHFRATDVGRVFYEHCRNILAIAEEAEAAAAEARSGEPGGDVRFSCPTGLVEIVAPTLQRFLARYPKVRLQMVALDRPVDPLQEGIDLAIRVRTKLDGATGLKMRSLGTSRRILVTSRDLAEKVDGDIDQLAILPTLGTSEEPGEMDWELIGPDGLTRKMRLAPRMRCGDFSAIREAAAEGLGIAFLPDHSCREHLHTGKLVRVFADWRGADGLVHVVFTSRKGLPVAVRAFIDHLVTAFPPGVLSLQDQGRAVAPQKGRKDECVPA